MSWRSEFDQAQKEVSKTVTNTGMCPGNVPSDNLFCLINSNIPENHSRMMFGVETYNAIAEFASYANLSHPDLNNFFDGTVTKLKENSFAKEFFYISKSMHYLEQNCNNSSELIAKVAKVIRKHKHFSAIKNTFSNPNKNPVLFRFIKGTTSRRQARLIKQTQPVCQKLLFKRGDSYIQSLPESFASFHRFQNRSNKESEAIKIKVDHFKKMGLPNIANSIHKSIQKLEGGFNGQMYCGFNYISLTQALAILAKIAGFKFNKLLHTKKLHNITIDRSLVDHRYLKKDTSELMLEGRVYPLHILENQLGVIPSRVTGFIKHTESNMPEFGGAPAFDNFLVLVPSIKPDFFVEKDSKVEVVCQQTSSIQKFESIDDYNLNCDARFIDDRQLPAIVLGERNGKTYFICYWI